MKTNIISNLGKQPAITPHQVNQKPKVNQKTLNTFPSIPITPKELKGLLFLLFIQLSKAASTTSTTSTNTSNTDEGFRSSNTLTNLLGAALLIMTILLLLVCGEKCHKPQPLQNRNRVHPELTRAQQQVRPYRPTPSRFRAFSV